VKEFIVTPKKVKLLREMLSKGEVTVNSQNIYTPLAFRLNIWYLQDVGLVINDGVRNREKVWKLTDVGIDIAKHLVYVFDKLNEIMRGDDER